MFLVRDRLGPAGGGGAEPVGLGVGGGVAVGELARFDALGFAVESGEDGDGEGVSCRTWTLSDGLLPVRGAPSG